MIARALIALALLLVCCVCQPEEKPVLPPEPGPSEKLIESNDPAYSLIIPADWEVIKCGTVLELESGRRAPDGEPLAKIDAIYYEDLKVGTSATLFRELEQYWVDKGNEYRREPWSHPLGEAVRFSGRQGVGPVKFTLYQYHVMMEGTPFGLTCANYSDDPEAFEEVFDRAFATWRPGNAVGQGH